MDALVGYTGFVGSNLMARHAFGAAFNSSNIGDAFGLEPDLLVFAGLRAEKFIANKEPEKDLESIRTAMKNIEAIKPKRLALISTIDVYPDPSGKDESDAIDESLLEPYGKHRLLLERWAGERFEHSHIFRLPGLYGANLKKNFIYDMINRAPSMLTQKKLSELAIKEPGIADFYEPGESGFLKRRALDAASLAGLLELLGRTGFSALDFTDSRSRFQFYNLSLLWGHLEGAIGRGIGLLNLATEPVGAGELFRHVYRQDFENLLERKIPSYDFRSLHAEDFGGRGGYIFDRQFILDDVKAFVKERQ